MSITSSIAHARGRKLAIAALLTLGLALPLSGTAPAAQNSQFTFPGLGGKNQNQDTDDTCPKGQMSPGGLLKGGNKGQESARNLIVQGGTCKVNTQGNFYYKAINILNGGVLQFIEPTTDKKDINFWASSIIIENGGKLVAGTKSAPFGSNGGSLTFYIYGSDPAKGNDPAANPGQGALCKTPEFKEETQNGQKVQVRIAGPCGIPLDAWTDNGKTPRSLPHADGVANISDRFYRYGPLYGDNLCSDGKAVWKSSAPCETDTGTIQVGYFGNKVIAVSWGGTLQLFGYKGTPLAKATTRNNGGNNGNGGGLGLFPGIGGSSSAGASSGSTGANAKQNSSISDRALELLLGRGHGGTGGGGSGGGSGGGVGGGSGGGAADVPACGDTDPDTGTTPFDPDTHPLSTGCSWLRLVGDLAGGENKLTLSSSVGAKGEKWWNGVETDDQIVVTSTDYLPGNSELLTIKSVSGTTVNFKEAIKWPHRGTRFPIASRLDPTDQSKPVRQRYIDAGMDQNLIDRGIETRAAVALLTRSIQIVSGGDNVSQTFEQAGNIPANCKANPPTTTPVVPFCYSYGAHAVFRQGFKQVQIQGVEFKYMGQGGKQGHYPVHFHMARQVPADTFIKDSAINESMTRWIVLHSTQGVLIQRNIGWKSIGHGFFLEDGTETDNKLYSNLGIMARAAVDNAQNPRKIPGILADSQSPWQAPEFAPPNVGNPGFPFRTDAEFPTAFWITNGWNEFVGNAAVGTGACGSGYWFVPTINSDMPDVPTADNSDMETVRPGTMLMHMLWTDKNGKFSYAGLQRNTTFESSTPLKVFYGNSSSATMMSFQTTTDAPACAGFIPPDQVQYPAPAKAPSLVEIKGFAPPPARIVIKNQRQADLIAPGPYYPRAHGLRAATLCAAGSDKPDCTSVTNRCSVGDGTNCAVTVLDHFTSSFTWAHGNVSAIWLRPQWYLLANSVITDVQNGGVTFVTGGDFTHSAVIPGYWAVMMDSILVGHTQTQDAAHKYSLDSGPVNKLSGLQCKTVGNGEVIPGHCVVPDQGISFPIVNFFLNQKLSNIYDGPSHQDSDVYLDITPTKCTLDSYNGPGGCIYGSGVASGLPKDPIDQSCYLPNAAIGWKQPNGFFYPPAFHTLNLLFDNVGIRHFVINPAFKSSADLAENHEFGQGGTYITVDRVKLATLYCTQPEDMFNGFTSIDRQTELNDDDGTLTGLSNNLTPSATIPAALKQTISVNEDAFFTAPVETPECATNSGNNPNSGANSLPANACKPPIKTAAPVTAKTSPYDYVATVVFHPVAEPYWDSVCSNPQCYGVPLYRQYLAGSEADKTREWAHWNANGCGTTTASLNKPECRWPFIRMAGEDTLGTRETLTVNNGLYYLDTAVPMNMQKDIRDTNDPNKIISHGENYNQQAGPKASLDTAGNVFQPGQTYYVFFLYAKNSTRQTYQIYVGKDPKNGSVKPARVQIPNTTLVPSQEGETQPWLIPDTSKVASDGIVSVTVDFSQLPKDANKLTELDPVPANGLCKPSKFCATSGTSCGSALDANDPAVKISPTLAKTAARACSIWAVKDLDCPTKGCLGFSFTLPDSSIFQADATIANPTPHRPPPTSFPVDGTNQNEPTWLVKFFGTTKTPDANTNGQCHYATLPSYPPVGGGECQTPDWVPQ